MGIGNVHVETPYEIRLIRIYFLALQFTRPIWGTNVPLLVFLLLFDTYINANSFFRVRWCVYILGYNCYRSG